CEVAAAEHFAQQGIAALVGAAELDAPAVDQGGVLLAGGGTEPAWHYAFGHGLHSLFHDGSGALLPAIRGADYRAGVGEGGGQQLVGLAAQTWRAYCAA